MQNKEDGSVKKTTVLRLPKVSDHLNEFVEKLLSRVADESKEGCEELVNVIKIAKKNYTNSWLKGITRNRADEIDVAILNIEKLPNADQRLEQIKRLASSGEWNPDSSFNYYLFVELIKSVPGYQPLRDKLVEGITLEVRDKIIARIDSFMFEYRANQKLKEAKDRELAAIHTNGITTYNNIILFNSIKHAQDSAKANPAKIHFCLNFNNKVWNIYWVDQTGKMYKLVPTDELVALLADHNIVDVEKANPVMAKGIKRECLRARDLFLERVPLIVNPKDSATHEEISNKTLIAKGTIATFILRGKPNAYSLYWVNTLGLVSEIPLNTYPDLMLWLNTQNTLNEEQLPELKAFLLNVNTSKALTGMDDFKNDLSNRLKGIFLFKAAEKTTPKPLDMSQFAAIAESLGARNGVKQVSPPTKSDKFIMNEDATTNLHLPVIVDDIPPLPEVDNLEFDARVDELPLPMLEESTHLKGKPVPPKAPAQSRLDHRTYADVVKLFGHKPKNDEPTPVAEKRSTNLPSN